MGSISRHLLLLIPIGILLTLPVMTVWSADEDIGSSVYLVFDPETGEFVTEVDPDIVNKDKLDYELGRASGVIDHTPPPASGTAASTVTQTATAEVPATTDSGSGISAIWIGSIIALGLVGGILAFRKKS
jgi:hypothetical protein